MFYDVYVKLCRSKRISPTAAALEMGFSKATPTKWKNTGATPQGKTLKTIASYFGVSESFLLQGEENQPTSYEDELIESLQILRDNPSTKILLKAGKHLKPEQIRKFADLMESYPEG